MGREIVVIVKNLDGYCLESAGCVETKNRQWVNGFGTNENTKIFDLDNGV